MCHMRQGPNLANGMQLIFPDSPPHLSTAPPRLQVNQGTVLSVGPGRRSTAGDLIPVAVKAGDTVLLPEYGGTPVKMDDKE